MEVSAASLDGVTGPVEKGRTHTEHGMGGGVGGRVCQNENNGRKGWDSQAEVQTVIPWWEPLLSQQPEPLVLSPSSLSASGSEGTMVGFCLSDLTSNLSD